MQAQPQAPAAPPPTATGELRDQIRQQLQETQVRIRDEVARATAEPGARTTVTVQPPLVIDDIPPRAAEVAMAFFAAMVLMVVLFPMARAVARRIDRRSEAPRLPADVSSQLTQLTQAVDAIAVEVERISEGQRFTTKLLNDLQSPRGSIAAPKNES